MKLFYSPASPFVRKVMISAIACGLDERITRVPTDPWSSPPDLIRQNPLSKVPCLVTEDGLALFDSPVICEYLDDVGAGGLVPAAGPARWRALKRQAVADGLMDAAILRRREQARPEAGRSAEVDTRQAEIVTRALDLLEHEAPEDNLDIGTISVACALGYLDFRFGSEPWRASRPHLASWFEGMQARPEMTRTAPP